MKNLLSALRGRKKSNKIHLDAKILEEKALNDRAYLARKSVFEILGKADSTQNKIVMLGDSITNFCEWSEFFPNSNILNRGIAGDTPNGIRKRLDAVAKLKPDVIFLMIGINCFSLCFNLNEAIETYGNMLKEIRYKLPNVKLYLQSVLPVRNGANIHIPNNDNIVALNKYIDEIAPDYEAEFINIYDYFCDNTGQMKEILAVDGIHLNGEGYKLWANEIRKYIEI